MLTKEEAIRQHRELWKWIAVETLRQRRFIMKDRYFRDKEPVCNDCYCCEYGEDFYPSTTTCVLCPIDWSSETNECMCQDKMKPFDKKNLYKLWLRADNYKTAALLAYKISKLPEKEFRFVIGKRVITEKQLREYYKQVESYDIWEEWIYNLLSHDEIKVK